MADPLHLPPRPSATAFPAFPVVGVLAPLAVALVLFVVTQTPGMLLFALFTPVLAIAAVLDGRRGVHRRRKVERSAYAAHLDVVERELDARIEQRDAAARRAHPRAARLAERADDWVAHPPAVSLVIGHADLPAEPLVGAANIGVAELGASTADGDDRERALLRRGRSAVAAPLVVPAATTVDLRGDPVLVEAMSRALAVQRARAGGPLATPIVRERADLVVEVTGPRSARVVGASAQLTHLDGQRFTPDLLSSADFHRVETALAGIAADAPALDLLLTAAPPVGGLSARFLLDGTEPVAVDLVEHGPHAVVGGTTGSGKSALLTAWMLAIAAAHPPSEASMLLIDCKGGAAFDRLARLPHVVGVVTDLDDDTTERAVRSLAAEVRRRERVLRSAGAVDVAGAELPRLVIVVDEFRVLLERWPDLASVFVDVAARGRSLGMHLVLCTQRPIGSMRSELLTNCALRIALRVNGADDSVALFGSDAAARLPPAPGGLMLALPGEPAYRCRVATIDPTVIDSMIDGVRASWSTDSPATAPWLPPLPRVIPEADLPPSSTPDSIVFGVLDLPEEQRQPPAEWIPRAGSGLLVLGGARSGRTTALALLARRVPGTRLLGDDVALAWDLLHDDSVPLAIDGLAPLLSALGERHAQAALDRLSSRLRCSSAAPTLIALPGPSAWGGLPLRQLVGLIDDVLLLGLPLEDHLASGGSRDTWSPRSRPGAGVYRGSRVQVALAAEALDARPAVRPPFVAMHSGRWLLVTDAPARRTAELKAAGVPIVELDDAVGSEVGVTVASPEALQRAWALFQRSRAETALLLDHVGPLDARTITGRADLLPPVSGAHDVLLVPSEGAVVRRRLPIASA